MVNEAGWQMFEMKNEEEMLSLTKPEIFLNPPTVEEMMKWGAKAKESGSQAKVISLGSIQRYMRYAAAAAVIGFIAVSAWLYTNRSTTGSLKEPELHQFSDTELQHFVESENTIISEPFTASSEVLTEEDIKDLFADISDEELQKYIDEESGVKRSHTN